MLRSSTAMVTLVQQAPGQNKWLLLAIMWLIASCSTTEDSRDIYYDASTVLVKTKGGITFINDVRASGVLFSRDAAGDTISFINYFNGKEEGWSKFYYAKGKPKAFRYYLNGWKEGEHAGWFENGTRQFIYHFKNDKFHGNQKEWLANGQIYSDQNYDEGAERGSQKIWYADGTIKTNYVIKNNRRYGLLGTKNCINTVDSVFVR
jgi:antitoxin component YwqK of YwqJK toxin-antitoxin module